MLLAWLFGVAAGVANACQLNTAGPAGEWQAGSAGEPEHPGSGHDDTSPARHNCADFCDKSSVAVSASKLPDRFDPGALPIPVGVTSSAARMPGPTQRHAVAMLPARHRGPGIPTACLRLTL
ncbi:hypothetical protein [Ideonella sp.]|uniref:hypothetical protein n=1 Tax=Ideonella sp. TaxID=1929293 RepID=UPI002B47A18E|nr:hypothetical protein [Ideonella sp.]HJV71493.1 hypothetical protein [Ideonella sp.]